MNWVRLIFITSIIFSFSFSSINQGTTFEKVSVQLQWKHQFQFAGFYMAKEKGFYKELGLDVDIKEYTNNINVVDEVRTKKSTFGVGRSSLFLDIFDGKDLFLLLNHFQSSPHILLAKKRDDLQTITDLKNKKIMIDRSEINTAAIEAMLQINGLDANNLTKVPNSFDINDLITNKVDAMSAYTTNEPYLLKKRGIEYQMFKPSSYGYDFFSDILFCDKKFFKNNQQLVAKFYKATKKGWEYAFKNIEESALTIIQKYNTQNKTYSHIVYEAKELKNLAYKDNESFGTFNMDKVNTIVQTFNLLHLSHIKENNFLDNIYYQSIYNPFILDTHTIKQLSIIAIVILLLLVLLIYRYLSLEKLNNKIKEQKSVIDTLLNSASQGFLLFDEYGTIDEQYSQICKKFFLQDIGRKNILDLLYKNNPQQKEYTKIALDHAYKEPNNAETFLSIIPQEIELYNKFYTLEFLLKGDDFILIISDITNEKEANQKAKKEQEKLKMIVNIVSDPRLFNELVIDYKDFFKKYKQTILDIDDPNESIENIYRTLHTLKGLFSEFYISDIVNFIHTIETKISFLLKKEDLSNNDLISILDSFAFEEKINEILKTVEKTLDKDIFNTNEKTTIDPIILRDLQYMLENLHCDENDNRLQNIKDISIFFNKQKLTNALHHYQFTLEQFAKSKQKKIYPLELNISHSIYIQDELQAFIKTLVHLFRNIIDHGIDFAKQREKRGKSPRGKITIKAYNNSDNDLVLSIADDGLGIDIQKVKQKAQELNIDTTNLSDKEIQMLIFNNHFTTKDSISTLSGRGVGLNAIAQVAKELHIGIDLESKTFKGTNFIFTIPKQFILIYDNKGDKI